MKQRYLLSSDTNHRSWPQTTLMPDSDRKFGTAGVRPPLGTILRRKLSTAQGSPKIPELTLKHLAIAGLKHRLEIIALILHLGCEEQNNSNLGFIQQKFNRTQCITHYS